MLYRPIVLVLPILLALVFAACGTDGSSAEQTATNPPVSTQASTQPPAESGAPAQAFPVTIDAENGQVVLDEQPDRIVSISPTATESLFAIGAGDQVIAVDDQSTYPADAPVSDLSGFEPNIEAIVALEPDLVVAGFDPGGLVDGLEKVGVTVLLQPAAIDLADAYQQIEELGTATGHTEEADELVASMEGEIEELAASVSADAADLSVYHELGPDYFSATSQTFIGSVYELLGLENIADEAGAAAPDYPQLSGEYIISADPDLIVLADTTCCGQTAKKVANRPGWDEIGAVADGNVIPVDDDIASRWGPRTVDFVDIIADAVTSAGAG